MKALYKHELISIIKGIPSFIFSILFPILWIVFLGMIISVPQKGPEKIETAVIFTALLPVGLSFNALIGTLIAHTIQFSKIRTSKQIKQLSFANINAFKYLTVTYLEYLTLFASTWVIQLIISFSAFGAIFSWNMLITCFAFPFLTHFLSFLFSVIIGNISNNPKNASLIAVLIMYYCMFTAGYFPLIPNNVLIYIQLMSPNGCINAIATAIALDKYNWQVLAASIVLCLYLAIIGFLSYKTFKWI